MTMQSDPGELLSGYLDGELPDDERARVERLLADDPRVRAELDELAAVRSALRALPPVALPDGFTERLLAAMDADDATAAGPTVDAPVTSGGTVVVAGRFGGRRGIAIGAGILAAAATVAVIGMVVVGGSDEPTVVPPVGEFASRHGAMADLVASGATEVPDMPDDFEQLDPAAMGEDAPSELPSGFERMAGFEDEQGTMHVVYTHDDMAVSVYRQEGEVDWGSLPPTGTSLEMEGAPAWLHTAETPRGTEEIMVLQQGDTVYTFVAAVPHDAMVAVVEDVAFS